MEVSVIIPTYNGASKIAFLLNALALQTYPDFEIVIVVDGSTDNTLEVIEKFKMIFRKLKVIYQQNAGRSVVRNRGVKEASGELLIFYDDDMMADVRSVEGHVAFHSKYYGLLSGNQVELMSQKKTEIQNYKAFLTRQWTEKYKDVLNPLHSQNIFFTAANCSFPKDLFLSLNGFDERLTDAEDFDLAMRALQTGIPVYFDKTNISVHNDPISCKSYIMRQRQYLLAHQKLQALHPERQLAEKTLNPLKKLFYRSFSIGFFSWLIDRFNIFVVIPKKIRYKFYDVIIHSLAVVYPNVKLW